MRTHKMPGAPFGGKFVSVTNVANKIKGLFLTLKPINCFVWETCVVKCLHGNVTFVTAKQLPVGSVFLRKSSKMYVNASTSKKLKARRTYVLRVDEI